MDNTRVPGIVDPAITAAVAQPHAFLDAYPELSPEKPWTIPYPSLVALRFDDGGNYADFWRTASASCAINGVNLQPWDYAAMKGVPITLANIHDNLGTASATVLSKTQVGQSTISRGWEIAVHADTALVGHVTNDVAVAKADILSCKAHIETDLAGQNSSGVATAPSIPCHGYIMPGNIGANCQISGKTQADAAYGDFFRRYFRWCTHALPGRSGTLVNYLNSETLPYFAAVTVEVSSAAGGIGQAAVNAYLNACDIPGTRLIFYIHENSASSYLTAANFGALIDAIATLRDAGKVMPVTLSGLLLANTQMPRLYKYTATVDAGTHAAATYTWDWDLPVWNPVHFGTIANLPSPIATSEDAHGWWSVRVSTGDSVAIDATVGEVTPFDATTTSIKVVAASTGNHPGFRFRLLVPGGGRYILRWSERTDTAGVKVNRQITTKKDKASQSTYFLVPQPLSTDWVSAVTYPTVPNDSAWHKAYQPIAIPDDVEYVDIQLLVLKPGAGSINCWFDNFEWIRVG